MIIKIASRVFYLGLSAVACAACKDECRPHLNSVRFRYQDNRLQLHATNGHLLALWEAAPSEATGKPEAVEFLASLASVQRLLRDLKVTKTDETFSTINFTKARVVTGSELKIDLKKVDAQFPPTEQVTPGPEKTASLDHVGMSVEVLAVVIKAFAVAKADNGWSTIGMRYRFTEQLGPIEVTSLDVGPSFKIIMMPCRVDEPKPYVKPAEPMPASTAAAE